MNSRLTDTTSALIQAAQRLADPDQLTGHPHAGDIALEELLLAARDVVRAVNGLDPDKQPDQWSTQVPGTPYREDCPACSEIQDLCRYHQGYVDATADLGKAAA